MKVQELFEMPTLINRELTVTDVRVEIMSKNTLDREYNVLGHLDNDGVLVGAFIKKNNSSAIIGRLAKRDDEIEALHIICTLSFHPMDEDKRMELGEAGHGKVVQVDTVTAADEARGAGYGYQLYKFLLDAGYTVVSDNIHFRAGKELWKKIIRRSGRDMHNVYILTRGEYVKDKSGNPIAYNGSNIPEDQIWSEDTQSVVHFETLLVAVK